MENPAHTIGRDGRLPDVCRREQIMYEEERTRILEMVAAGTISAAQASDLLAALEVPVTAAVAPRPQTVLTPSKPVQRRYLVIEIDANGGQTKVNLRIPLGLARAISRFIPRQAQKHLSEYEINLEDLLEGVGSAEETGTLLEVSDNGGADHVRIAVE
jgi:hypothetical protein